MRKKQKHFSTLLVIAMLVSLIPATVFAAASPTPCSIRDAELSALRIPTYSGDPMDPDDFGIEVSLNGSSLDTADYALHFYTDVTCETSCTPTDAGVYYVLAEGVEAKGYTDGTGLIPVKINKAALGKPEAVSGTITYDGTRKMGVQLPDGADPALYIIIDGDAIEPGSYLATVQLAHTGNYCWAGEDADPTATGTSQPFDIPWTIEGQILPPGNYVVSFDMNGHGTTPAAITVTSGSAISAPAAPTARGYTFGGWYKDAACGQAWNFVSDVVTRDMTLYAKWTERNSPTPSYDPDPVTPAPVVETKSDAANCAKDDNCPISKYTDLDVTKWYHNGIHYCLDHGIMSGKTETEFGPNAVITRGEIAAMLWRLEGKPVVNYFMQFKDVAAGKYYSEGVRWMAAEKIAEGYSAECFGTGDAITREQLAVILYKYAQKNGEGFTGSWMFLLPFGDSAKISDYASEAAHWCYMKGIIVGKDGNIFDPKGKATRAEAACMIQRFCERNEEK